MPRSYSIIGAGALGAYYGALLQRSGKQVHYLVRTEGERQHMAVHGLRVESPKGDFTLPHASVACDPAALPKADVVVVALKTTQNDCLAQLLPQVTAPGSTLLCLQNGIDNEELLHTILPGQVIVGGLCFLCSHKIGPGHIRHLDYGPIRFADFHADHQARPPLPLTQAIAADFAAAGVSTSLSDDLLLARWMKLVWNIPFNGLCTLTGLPTDQLLAQPQLRLEAEALMQETVAGAAAMGKRIPPEFIAKMLADTASMASYRPSMLVDAELGRPLEWQYLHQRPANLAEERGVPLPRLHLLAALLAQADRRALCRQNH